MWLAWLTSFNNGIQTECVCTVHTSWCIFLLYNAVLYTPFCISWQTLTLLHITHPHWQFLEIQIMYFLVWTQITMAMATLISTWPVHWMLRHRPTGTHWPSLPPTTTAWLLLTAWIVATVPVQGPRSPPQLLLSSTLRWAELRMYHSLLGYSYSCECGTHYAGNT